MSNRAIVSMFLCSLCFGLVGPSLSSAADCNSNSVPDECDIDCEALLQNRCFTFAECGLRSDCNNNGMPDECETLPDCNMNGTADACETLIDCNTNDVPDECDIAVADSDDCDGNDVPDECQPDCNGDGVPDECELPPFGSDVDCNANGIPDSCDVNEATSFDVNANDIPDECDGGFFLAVEAPNGSGALLRIDLDGTVERIGSEGELGFPKIAQIVWDSDKERVLGYDSLLDVWLEIDPSTGRARALGELGAFTRETLDMTYNTNDGLIYALSGTVFQIVPDTGDVIPAVDISTSGGIAYTMNGLGGLSGYWSVNGTGLDFYTETNWTRTNVAGAGGSAVALRSLVSYPGTKTLYMLAAGNLIFVINTVTTNRSLMLDLGDLGTNLNSMVFVPGTPAGRSCSVTDTDNDGDIDLFDFSAYQECFTGPTP